jgi:hypothetical protein
MPSRYFLAVVLATPCVVYSVICLIYVINPSLFYFRGWEYFDNLVYKGVVARHQLLGESGDAARDYLIQRYTSVNNITVNALGNRMACYDQSKKDRPAVLMLGESQLFGSGVDDADTLPALLCYELKANIYNGSRMHELDLLRVRQFHFSVIVFATAERAGLGRYCAAIDAFEKVKSSPLEEADLDIRLAPVIKIVFRSGVYLFQYMQARLGALLQVESGVTAPKGDLIIARHHYEAGDKDREVACAVRLERFFADQGIKTGFVYFPAEQTLLSDRLGLQVDKITSQFIPDVIAAMKSQGLNALDARECLLERAAQVRVTQPHDTHLNPEGLRSMAQCVEKSGLRALFVGDGQPIAGKPAGD